jgi:hypothetical protein
MVLLPSLLGLTSLLVRKDESRDLTTATEMVDLRMRIDAVVMVPIEMAEDRLIVRTEPRDQVVDSVNP